jgi:signal transduction histidine kinase
MGDAVLVFAADGSLILSNPAADALLSGMPIREYRELLALLDEGEGEFPRLGWHRPQGPVEVPMRARELTWVEASAYPVLPPADALRGVDPSGPFETILLLRDVTQARVLRLARDTFIGVLSHELRTPVTTIYGNSKLLGSPDRNLAEEVREDVLKDIETEAERLYRLVEDLLVLARYSREDQTESRNEPLLLQRIVPSVLQSELRRWPLTRFEVDVDPGLPAVQGDRTYVEQVVRNLLSNAAKYSGEGTTVTVRLEDAEDEVRVRVLDQGPGFSPEDADRLFELFYRAAQTAARVSGAGIGLFVCKRLVEAMGGTIWATPRPEGGAEFGFTMNVFTEEGL